MKVQNITKGEQATADNTDNETVHYLLGKLRAIAELCGKSPLDRYYTKGETSFYVYSPSGHAICDGASEMQANLIVAALNALPAIKTLAQDALADCGEPTGDQVGGFNPLNTEPQPRCNNCNRIMLDAKGKCRNCGRQN